MSPAGCALRAIAAGVSLAALVGCGGGPAPPQPQEESPREAARHTITEATITSADPQGRWQVEIRAERGEAESVRGPYTLERAVVHYEAVGKPPVRMRADRARFEEAAARLTLEGSVEVKTDMWSLETPRLVYDLERGEVLAAGRTKWRLAGGRAAEASESGEDP